MTPQGTESHQQLRLLFWESTIKCNLNCAHCRRVEDDQAADSDMSTVQARQMVDQLADLGRSQDLMPLLVFSGGEPLCRTDIFELIDYAVTQKIVSALATNGTLIDKTIAQKIKESGVKRISVSLDGATSDIHNKLRKQNGSFEAAINGINCLNDIGAPFQINMTITRHNAHQLEDIFVLAKQLNAVAVHLFMLVPVGCGEEIPAEDMLSPAEYEDMMHHIARIEHDAEMEIKVTCGPHYERVVREQNPNQQRMSKGCLAGSGVIFVSHSGDVFPCGYLPVHCGNILKTPLKEIWTGSKDFANMRDTNQLKGKCGICGYRAVCGGCRARAFAATGDYMQAEPMCTYKPPETRASRPQ